MTPQALKSEIEARLAPVIEKISDEFQARLGAEVTDPDVAGIIEQFSDPGDPPRPVAPEVTVVEDVITIASLSEVTQEKSELSLSYREASDDYIVIGFLPATTGGLFAGLEQTRRGAIFTGPELVAIATDHAQRHGG